MTNKKYAQLLVNYCLGVQSGEKVYVQSTTLAEDLIREVYREIINAGGHPEIEMRFREQNKIFLDGASDHQLEYVSPISKHIIENFDAYLSIRAPYNLREDAGVDKDKRAKRSLASKPINDTFSKRTANGSLRRSLCQYPTNASAQEAGMSLEDYREFVFNACHLNEAQPVDAWLAVRAKQQKVVDILNTKNKMRYVNKRSDITFSVKDRIWINSDGRVNMPSGEVFTGPVEDSVNGQVHFDYPSIFMGKEVAGVTLEVIDGKIEKWGAERGGDILDDIMKIKGSRYFGEAAIGTNYNITQPTKNILFDEKIGGTIHMAVGQSYFVTGGKNESTIHWDMIADMQDGGQIYADEELIYENGKFLFL